jgi:hypothetical protein
MSSTKRARPASKAGRSTEDPRLVRLTGICLALPEASRDYNGQHASYLVRKKTFAYYLDDHHGDGIVALACKVLTGDNARLAASDPARFYLPPTSDQEAGSRCGSIPAKSIGRRSANSSAAAIS